MTESATPAVCDGCGKPPKHTLRNCPTGLVEVAVAPGRVARVCLSARSSNYERAAIESCRQAALGKARFCRGCGVPEPTQWKTDHFNAQSEVCHGCRLTMEQGRAAQAVEPRAWYVMATFTRVDTGAAVRKARRVWLTAEGVFAEGAE